MRPGWKTSEFWVTVFIQIIGILATTGVLTSDQASALSKVIIELGGLIAMVASAFGYSIARGIAKKGQ